MAHKSKDESIIWLEKHISEIGMDTMFTILFNYMSSDELERFVEFLKTEGY